MKSTYKRNRIILKNQRIFSETKKRFVIYIAAFTTCFVFSLLMNPFYFQLSEFTDLSFETHILNFTYGLFFVAVISELSIFIDKLLIKYIPFNKQSSKRLFVQFIFQIIGSAFFTLLFWLLMEKLWCEVPRQDNRRELTLLAQFFASNIMVSILISTFNTVDYLTENWKRTSLEASQHKMKALELQKAALSAELQALKLQIDPHFIFNNLSVLSELILEDQQAGYEYSESFAKVYRYLLLNSKKDAISLKEELKFLNSYLYLTQQRVGKGVCFEIDVDEKYLDFVIPPLVLQLLVENALKHNQTSEEKPLSITISTSEDGYITVKNSISPLITSTEESGVGLKNLINRLEYIGERKTIITKTSKEFTAKIPLYENI